MDYNHEAVQILYQHSEGVMSCTSDLSFTSTQDMWEFTIQECAFILTNNFLEGKYTPMEFNAIRNELASIINKLFEPTAVKEQEHLQ